MIYPGRITALLVTKNDNVRDLRIAAEAVA